MKDLLQLQVKESCRLALPEGLQDLMSDISREVLRAQPSNLCQFIADYLSALLVARENLTIAAKLCTDVCAGSCYPELEDELRFLGLADEDAKKVVKYVLNYFEGGEVNETKLMIKIASKTDIEESQLSAIQEAVRRAYQRHMINTTTVYETSSDSDLDEVSRAAKHTLQLYRKTKHTPEEYNKAATKVQAAYRAYDVRRKKYQLQESSPPHEKVTEKNLRFSADVSSHENMAPTSVKPCYLPTVSSTSLAGSYMNLPKYVPYSVHDLYHVPEDPEKENHTIDYTEEEACSSSHRRISFQEDPQEIEDQAIMADDESEKSVDEVVYEHHYETESEGKVEVEGEDDEEADTVIEVETEPELKFEVEVEDEAETMIEVDTESGLKVEGGVDTMIEAETEFELKFEVEGENESEDDN
ncbi:uncharacterized protein LOC114357159 [Ostrinia furnacalis]|uniref:uncharacterized protein LOC114357159 n=1 Tax=Ostrinia furnacalis TaxID=93504 RepID=UPI00103CB79D|nr:uncharacterized protein LOC114357159 [Ostrinia furnacalis]